MKRIFTFLITIFLVSGMFAQSPEKMSYQAVVRNSSDALVTNTQVGMQISILQGSASGTAVYTETQTPTTNANGLVSIEIGSGSTSDDFSAIDWTGGPYFIKTETAPEGGTNYTITGTSQLLSVPYALHAKTAESVTGTISEIDPAFAASVASGITSQDTAAWNAASVGSYLETDPVYTASQAANITATDITNLGNLSGTNTGDQDLSTLATKTALGDSTAKVRGEIPDVSGFLTVEVDGSVTNELELPDQSGNSGKYLTTNGSSPSWSTVSTGAGQLSELSDVNTSTATSGNILVANGTAFGSVSVSGDATLASSGALTIADNSVDGTDIALGSDAAGDVMYYDGTNWVRLAKGSDNQVLTLSGGVPTWAAAGSGGGGISSYGFVYRLGAQTLAGGADVVFSNNGPLSGITHTAGTASIVVPSTGNYKIDYTVFTNGAGSEANIAVAVNGVVDASTNIQNMSNYNNLSGTAILSLTAGDVITLRNNSAISMTLDSPPRNGAQITIIQLD